jgi:hypothetical protein
MSGKVTKNTTKSKGVPDELQLFVNARKRPAIFLCDLGRSLGLGHVVLFQKLLNGKRFDELDIIIHSSGGDINAAYQIVELLRMHTDKLNACVPLIAKSAATLICIGADKIILDELSQLGPLDTQIVEKKKGGKTEFSSALNPFKALEQLQTFSVETLDLAMKVILERSGMEIDECLTHAIEFVKATTGPLITQLNPEKLGEYSRALSVGEEYGTRLLMRFQKWEPSKAEEIIQRLVHGYPSHEYIIDYHELQDLGFEVELFHDHERQPVRQLINYLVVKDKREVRIVEPLIEEATETVSGEGEAAEASVQVSEGAA